MLERRNSNEVEMRVLEYERNLSFYESKCKNFERVNSELLQEKEKVADRLHSL
jgi:hypothetical protein